MTGALLLVERAVALVRRRRSVTAVESYEQVRFLLKYVEYLRARSIGLRE
jgi:protein-tyrosine phosphatase